MYQEARLPLASKLTFTMWRAALNSRCRGAGWLTILLVLVALLVHPAEADGRKSLKSGHSMTKKSPTAPSIKRMHDHQHPSMHNGGYSRAWAVGKRAPYAFAVACKTQ
jgi:hypothetical protein